VPARQSLASEILPQHPASVTACRNVDQRSSEIRKFAGIEDLDTRVMLPVEGGDDAWAACFYRVLRVVEPQAQVINLDRARRAELRANRSHRLELDRSESVGQMYGGLRPNSRYRRGGDRCRRSPGRK
jgi:hypothetical protein